MSSEIRYYMGRIECEILKKGKKKALIAWNENGTVGNKDVGYKIVHKDFEDIVPIRCLWRIRK